VSEATPQRFCNSQDHTKNRRQGADATAHYPWLGLPWGKFLQVAKRRHLVAQA